MLLSHLKAPLLHSRFTGSSDVEVLHLAADSRRVRQGTLFFALRGLTHDGHDFVRRAGELGAVAAVVDHVIEGVSLPQLVVPDAWLASAIMADRFYGYPSHHLRVLGVTGTKGKSTVSHLIDEILRHSGRKSGLIGTLGLRIHGRDVSTDSSTPTTPQALELQGMLWQLVDAGCEYAVMEVSSQALDIRRDAGTRYRAGVFTNLAQDHLDYHHTIDAYRAAKGKLFSRLGNTYGESPEAAQYAVLNIDDAAADYMAAQTVAQCVTYGFSERAQVRAHSLSMQSDGTTFEVDTFHGRATVKTRLSGRFNVYNALAALSVALLEDIPLDDAVLALGRANGVPGRMEKVEAGQPFQVIVDYAHTADSLANVLTTVREFAAGGRVITVIGCGGDRDKTKRPIMANIAVAQSDLAIFTSDNPRTEDPEAILDDMEAGVAGNSFAFLRIVDRRQAIERAISTARAGDIVLIAGKGHETYQIVGHTKHHFDDREVAREIIMGQ